MDDLIERNAVLAYIDCCLGNSLGGREEFDRGLRQARKFIINTPAVHWIPCVRLLPEQDGEYLVFTEQEDVFKCTFDSNEENKWGFRQDCRDPDTLGWTGTTWTAVETVTHWMPLPKPPEN